MSRGKHKNTNNNTNSLPQTPKNQKIKPENMKEEISLELAEIDNLRPKQEPMTPNKRQKSEKEKWY
ncbi:YfhD family protein [Sporosarcina sp. CAU 1771]